MDVVDKIKKGDKANNGAVENPDRMLKVRVAGDES
jgi:peptidylprolyl isomerase